MALSANIRYHRKKTGMTQIELADKLGVSIATLRRWEAGETAPTGTRIIELANLLGTSPDEIISQNLNLNQNPAEKSIPDFSSKNKGMLIFEGEGTRIELPPTEKGYELFNKLVDNLIQKNNNQHT